MSMCHEEMSISPEPLNPNCEFKMSHVMPPEVINHFHPQVFFVSVSLF